MLETESFSEMFEESIKDTEMRPGKVILGQVVNVSAENVTVNAGLKSEAEIPIVQFKDFNGVVDVKVGDEVEVEIEAVEDGYGRTRLSREKACRARAWEEIEKSFNEQTVIKGQLISRVKGGFTVSVYNMRAFLPGSLYGVRPVMDGDDDFELEKDPIDLKIIKLDRMRNNIVVSRRAVLEKELTKQREKLLATLKEGLVLDGIVKNLTNYGVFVNLGGIDGLLHITDLSWRRVKHPSELLSVGEEVTVKVLHFDREKSRISLGMKQLTDPPWLRAQKRYKAGDRVMGIVASIVDYGLFVEIEEDIKGLVHVSEMDWTSRNIQPAQVCSVGDEVEVMILSVDTEKQRISLGMKQCKPNPWIEFAANHEKGDRITGTIKSLTDFGIFVSLENGIDGLVHINDVDWYQDGEEGIRKYSKGEEIEVVVLAIDAERERISLGIKQTTEDPYIIYVSEHNKGAIVDGTIREIHAREISLDLANGVVGTIRNAQLAKTPIKDPSSVFEAGQEIRSKIVSIDRKLRKIYLSIKAFEVEKESEEFQQYASQDPIPARTLGTKLKEKLFSGPAEN